MRPDGPFLLVRVTMVQGARGSVADSNSLRLRCTAILLPRSPRRWANNFTVEWILAPVFETQLPGRASDTGKNQT